MEEGTTHAIGSGLSTADKSNALTTLVTTPLDFFHCPSRRDAVLTYGPEQPRNATPPPGNYVAKSDYAGNGGSYCPTEGPIGWSGNPSRNCLETFPACNWGAHTLANIQEYFDGPIVPRFPIELEQITDGTSHTMLVGEKYLFVDHYGEGTVGGFERDNCSDNNAVYQGYDWDIMRWANHRTDLDRDYTPKSDTTENPTGICATSFGSAHTSGFNVVLCDGSVDTIDYDVDMIELELLARRNDGGVPVYVPTSGRG
jgi:hypothetical protein